MSINRKSDTLFDCTINAVSALIIILVAYPLIYVVSASLSDPVKMLNGEVWLFPKGINIEAYGRVFRESKVWLGYRNSIFYTVIGTIVNLILTTILAYPLSRKTLPGRNVIMFIITFTMFFGGGLIPSYLLVRDLHMNNTVWALIIPGAIWTYNVIVMRTYFQTNIADELLESAYMDGCTHTGAFLKIVLPLSSPIIAVMVLFYGVGHWNSFFPALIYLRNTKLYPLQLILREILLQNKAAIEFDSYGSDKGLFVAESMKYALIIVASLPVLILYPFVQKYFVKGIMVGAIKG